MKIKENLPFYEEDKMKQDMKLFKYLYTKGASVANAKSSTID